MPFSCSLPKLGNPLLVHGCIKLMQSITRFGRPSPFSYEYGHLCFQILVVAFNFCLLKLAIPHDEWIEDVASQELQLQEGHIPVLSKTISETVLDRLTWGNDDHLYCALVRSEEWEDYYDYYEGPLITPDHIHTLQRLLDKDQKNFLIFLRSHYSVCLSGLLYTLYRHIDFKRFPLDPGFHHAFCQFYCRTLLLAPGYPLGESIHQDLMSMSEEHNFTVLDTEDSRSVFLAYIDRLTRLSVTGIHPRASPALALGLLQYAQMLVRSGCESLVPSVIRVTFQCIWRELADGSEPAITLIEHCGQLLKCVLGLLEFLLERAKSARGILLDALDAIVQEELISLVMRILLVVRPTGAQTIDTKGPIGYLIHTAISIIQVFRTAISSTCIEHRFRHDIGGWIAFLENSPRVIIPKSHRFPWMRCNRFLSRTVVLLGGGESAFDNRCVNPRCPGSMKAAYTASDLAYCSVQCCARACHQYPNVD
ncbi:unnamed protein product [Rhizoctonia solani]|uniref:Uncharacterized protein n=1 Tax=Rhizoctonia solani TaxID=456999 RepID=A0A8H3CEB2_9AGAM|nr:unnamed protein product [Rhizoctonia solani]